MANTLSDEVKQLVHRPNFGHLATLMSDGSPHSAPVWIRREGDLLFVCTEAGSLKEKIRSAPPAFRFLSWNLSIPTQKFKFVGRVIERRSDAQLKYYDAMSLKYVSKPWPYRDEKEAIVLLIGVKRVRYSEQPFDHTPPSRGFLEPK